MKLLSTPVKPKKLPDAADLKMVYHEGDPVEWKDYLRSEVYWNAELEQ